MERPELDITISRTGKVTVEVKGAKGPRCLKYADLIQEIIGREDSRRLTEEYYQPGGQVRIDAQVKDASG
jgi:hypothetical protein